MAVQIGAEAVRFDELKRFLRQADIVVTATASPHFIIRKETLAGTHHRRLIIMDLALPRDVDPEVKELNDIELFDLEDLGSTIQENLERRKIEADRVKGLIDVEVEKLWLKVTESQREPALLP